MSQRTIRKLVAKRIRAEGDTLDTKELLRLANAYRGLGGNRPRHYKKAEEQETTGKGRRLDAWEKLLVEARKALHEGRYEEWEKQHPISDEAIRAFEAVHKPQMEAIELAQGRRRTS